MPRRIWTTFFEKTEGGRLISSHPNETNDCAVKALVNALKMPYDEAHSRLKEHGRKDRHGTRFFKQFLQTKLRDYDIEVIDFNITLFQFMKNKPIGTYIIGCRDHTFCIEGGIIKDTFLKGMKSKITFFAKVKGKRLTNPPEVTTL
jgi:hypothetical protein